MTPTDGSSAPLLDLAAVSAKPGRLLAGAVLAGAIISAGDHMFHVRTGVLVHHWHPQLDGQMIVVIPTFMAAAAAMLVAGRALGGDRLAPSVPALAFDTAWFLACYWLSGQMGLDRQGLLLAGLYVLFGLRLVAAPPGDAVRLGVLGVLIAVGGCLGEGAISALGAFDYQAPDVVRVPFWLLPLYLNGAPAVLGLARATR